MHINLMVTLSAIHILIERIIHFLETLLQTCTFIITIRTDLRVKPLRANPLFLMIAHIFYSIHKTLTCE